MVSVAILYQLIFDMKYTFSNRDKVLLSLIKFLVLVTGAIGILAYSIFKKPHAQSLQKITVNSIEGKFSSL